MTKAKKTKKQTKQTKKNKINADIAIVLMIVISILLAVLIYTESGYIGEILSPMLGRTLWIYEVYYSNWNICNSDIFGI